MKGPALVALFLGIAAFTGVLGYEGFTPVAQAFAVVGWGILAVIAVHALPLVLDSLGAMVLLSPRPGLGAGVLARWISESVNGLLPVAQMGGAVAMARALTRAGVARAAAAGAVTVATTQQMTSQAVFGGLGLVMLLGAHESFHRAALLWGGTALFALNAFWFQRLQRQGLFARLAGLLVRLAPGRSWLDLTGRAQALDRAVQAIYQSGGSVALSFAFNLAGWAAGTAEVWLALRLLGHPVSVQAALILESLGQAIRGIAFAIPGALGVQEGGFLLLGSAVGLAPETALALSLCKRARELALGLPGLAAWQILEGRALRRQLSMADHPAAH